jgi:hypothetical protein
MNNGDVATEMLAEVGGFEVVLPEMWESSALGSALLSGIVIGLFGRSQRRLDVSIRRVGCTLCCDYVLGARLIISWIENAQKKRRRYAEVYFAFGQALLENAIARLRRNNKTMMIPLLTLPRRPSQAVALTRTDEAELENDFNAAWDVLRVA